MGMRTTRLANATPYDPAHFHAGASRQVVDRTQLPASTLVIRPAR